MEKQPSLFDDKELNGISRQDERLIHERIKMAIQSGAPEYEIDYWESYWSEVDRVSRERLGNLAYGKRTTGRITS